MTFVITGSLGNISKPLTKLLVKTGHKVIVIINTADRKSDIESLGATAAIGSLLDTDFLTATFSGADAVYTMTPHKYDETDSNSYYKRVATCYAAAIRASGVKRVVVLSTLGADLSAGTGFNLGLYYTEQILGAIEGVSFTFLRPGFFFTNVIHEYKALIKQAGFIGSNYGGSDRLLMVHPADIAAVAAEELQTPGEVGIKVRYVVSEEHSCNEAAAILGAAIGKPDLKWLTFSTEEAIQGMIQGGLHPDIARDFAELGAGIHTGIMNVHYDSLAPIQRGPSTLQDYAVNEFAPAFDA